MSVAAWKKPVCDLCDIKYQNMQDFNKHMANIHFETDSMRLDRLEMSLKSGSNQTSTILPSVDTLKVKEIKNNKSTDCSECGIFFNTTEAHAPHIKKHQITKVKEVKVCDNTLLTKN